MNNSITTFNKNVNKLKSAVLISSITLAISACGGSSSPDTQASVSVPTPVTQAVSIDYQTIIDETVSATILGIVLFVESPEKRFLAVRGLKIAKAKIPCRYITACQPRVRANP